MKLLKQYLLLIAKGLTHKLFDFNGRASRTELITLILMLATIFISGEEIIFYLAGYTFKSKIVILVYLIACLSASAIVIAILALTSRRLHDLNFRGWWQIIILCNPVALIASNYNYVAAYVLCLIPYLFLLLKKGTLQANKFGDVPRI